MLYTMLLSKASKDTGVQGRLRDTLEFVAKISSQMWFIVLNFRFRIISQEEVQD